MTNTELPIILENGTGGDLSRQEPLPWPAMMAFLTAWLLPATTARRTRTVPLLHAYGIHLLAAAATVLLVVALVALDEGRDVATIIANDIVREFDRDWQEALLVTMVVIFLVEGGFLALALVALPWGAGDEPLRSSWAHSLRHTWLHSTHALPAVLAVGLLIIGYDHMRRDYYSRPQANPAPIFNPPAPPVLPSKPTPQQQADHMKRLGEWQKEVKEARIQYSEARRAYLQNRPFLIRHGEYLLGVAGCLTGAWVLWALFRAVGAVRPIAPVQRPPTCEFCGYNLVATPVDSRCPECGEPVAASLGSAARLGSPWERRRETGWIRAWRQTASQAVLSPRQFGRHIRVCSTDTSHRLFLIGHLPIIFVVTAAATVLSFLASANREAREAQFVSILCGLAPMIGIIATSLWFALIALTAGLAGTIYTLSHKRNLLPATARISSYLAGYLTLWACFSSAWCVLTTVLVEARYFHAWRQPYGLDPDFLAFCFWMGPTLLGFLGYAVLLWKATASTPYANK